MFRTAFRLAVPISPWSLYHRGSFLYKMEIHSKGQIVFHSQQNGSLLPIYREVPPSDHTAPPPSSNMSPCRPVGKSVKKTNKNLVTRIDFHL